MALVEALIAARLLVSDEDAAGQVFVRVAHEALLSRWPRASDIVNANRNFLETRARLIADAERWQSDNGNQELLLPLGKRLAEGEDLLQSRRKRSTSKSSGTLRRLRVPRREREEKDRQGERALIEAAEAAAEAASQLARRTRYAAILATLLALMAGLGAFFGFIGQEEATRQAELAEQSAGKARSAEKAAIEAERDALGAVTRRCATSLFRFHFFHSKPQSSGDTEAAILLALEALPNGNRSPRAPTLRRRIRTLQRILGSPPDSGLQTRLPK